jgi:transcriptional regulator with XRE-family HTH domain
MRWRDLASELDARPGFREAYAEQFPYANVALAVVGLRARHDLTQRALAERVGTPQPVIARLESGRHPVEIKLLSRIATAVGESWTVAFSPRADAIGTRNVRFATPIAASGSREVTPNRR